MSEDADRRIVARIHDAFNRRGLAAIADELTEDVVFHRTPGVRGAPPTMRGRDQVLRNFERMSQLGDQRIDHRNAELVAGLVVALSSARFTVAGEPRSVQVVHVCRLRDDRLAERWVLFDEPAEVERIVADLAAQEQLA